jgi:hypothetical protein
MTRRRWGANGGQVHGHEPCDVTVPSANAAGLVAVHSCSRLGRRANPPFSLADWLLPRRRR